MTIVHDEEEVETQEFVVAPNRPSIPARREIVDVCDDGHDGSPCVPQQASASPSLDSPYTPHITSPFRLDLPDPGDHRPWYHLDWSSPASLRHNQHKLTRLQRWYLHQIDERVKAFPETFARTGSDEDDYRTVACMIAMACSRSGGDDHDASEDLPFKDRFLRCRRIKYKTGHGSIRCNGRCRQRRFCPFCNFLLRQEALLTYVPAFDKGRWYSMTISSTADLDLELDELTYPWDAVKAVVRALLDAGHFLGAYWTEELHLETLYPEIRVLPHGHVLFHVVADVDKAAVQTLAAKTFRRYFVNLKRRMKRRNSDDGVVLLKPDIDMVRLQTKDGLFEQCASDLALPAEETASGEMQSLYRWCDYLTKTVRVVDAYGAAMEAVPDEERWRVNSNFEQFLSGLLLTVEEDSAPQAAGTRAASGYGERPKRSKPRTRQQRHSLGTLRPGRSQKFVGIRPARRHEHRRELEEVRRRIITKRKPSCEDATVEPA